MGRHSQEFKTRAIARLLPLESAPVLSVFMNAVSHTAVQRSRSCGSAFTLPWKPCSRSRGIRTVFRSMPDRIPLIHRTVRHRPGPVSVMLPEWCRHHSSTGSVMGRRTHQHRGQGTILLRARGTGRSTTWSTQRSLIEHCGRDANPILAVFIEIAALIPCRTQVHVRAMRSAVAVRDNQITWNRLSGQHRKCRLMPLS